MNIFYRCSATPPSRFTLKTHGTRWVLNLFNGCIPVTRNPVWDHICDLDLTHSCRNWWRTLAPSISEEDTKSITHTYLFFPIVHMTEYSTNLMWYFNGYYIKVPPRSIRSAPVQWAEDSDYSRWYSCRHGVRDGMRQDHTCSRPEWLRLWPSPRTWTDLSPQRRRHNERWVCCEKMKNILNNMWYMFVCLYIVFRWRETQFEITYATWT